MLLLCFFYASSLVSRLLVVLPVAASEPTALVLFRLLERVRHEAAKLVDDPPRPDFLYDEIRQSLEAVVARLSRRCPGAGPTGCGRGRRIRRGVFLRHAGQCRGSPFKCMHERTIQNDICGGAATFATRDGRFEKTRNGCGVGGRDPRVAVLLTLLFLLSVLSTTIIEYYYRYGVVPTGMGKRGPPRRLTTGRRLIAGPPRTRALANSKNSQPSAIGHQPSAISHQPSDRHASRPAIATAHALPFLPEPPHRASTESDSEGHRSRATHRSSSSLRWPQAASAWAGPMDFAILSTHAR
jgi:hypothetical protein